MIYASIANCPSKVLREIVLGWIDRSGQVGKVLLLMDRWIEVEVIRNNKKRIGLYVRTVNI